MSRLGAIVALLLFAPIGSAQVRKVIRDFPHAVDAVAFSPDGKTLATGTAPTDGGKDAVRLWDMSSGRELCSLGDDYKFGCNSLAFSPDGKTLVANGGPGDTLRLWDVNSRKVRLTIKVPPGIGYRIAVSPDSKTLAATEWDRGIRLYDMKTGMERLACKANLNALTLEYSPNGKMIAGSTFGGSIALWDVSTGKHKILQKHMAPVGSVAFSPDSKTLYSLGDELLVYWDTATSAVRRTVELSKPWAVRYMGLSRDGKTLAVVGGGLVRLFDVESAEFWSGVEWADQGNHRDSMAFSPDGKQLVCGSGGSSLTNAVYLYDVPQRRKKPHD